MKQISHEAHTVHFHYIGLIFNKLLIYLDIVE